MINRFRSLHLTTGFWALADQGVVSAGTFLVSILMARVLPAADYGGYGLIVGSMIFVNSLHAALVTYPLAVKGAPAEADELLRLAGASLVFTAAMLLPFGLVVFGVTVLLGRTSVFGWALLALVAWQLQETLRRAMHCRMQHRRALWGDAVSYLGQVALVWLLARRGFSLNFAFALMALTSGLALAVQLLQVRARLGGVALWRLGLEYWDVGKWYLLNNLVNVVAVQAYPWAVASFCGLEEAAYFQAVANILGVTNPVLFGIGGLILPAVAKARHAGRGVEVRRIALCYTVQGAVLLFPYYFVLLCWPHEVLMTIYGGNSPYLGLKLPLQLSVLTYLFGYLAGMGMTTLNGIERGAQAFLAQLASVATVLALGLPLTAQVGLIGAVVGSACATLARLVVSGVFLRRYIF